MRNWPVYLLLAVACIGALLMFSSESEPLVTARALAQAICPTPNTGVERDVLSRHLAERVDVALSDDQTLFERADLIERLAQLRATYPSCALELVDVRATPGESAGSFRVRGDLEYSESEASDLHAARRELDATFRGSGKEYRLERVELGPVRRPPPEARP